MHAPVTNIETQLYNENRLARITDDLVNVYFSLFRWVNLPYETETVRNQVSRYIEYLFGTKPRIGAYYDETKGLIFGEAVGDSGLTWYNDYYSYTITNEVESKNGLDRTKVAITRPNPLGTPILTTVNFYAGMIWQCERAIFVNVRGQNTPLIIEAPKGQELTYANAYEQIAGYKPVVFGRADYGIGDQTAMHYFSPAPFVADQLMDMYQRWYGEYFNRCGLEAKTNDKRERLVAAEVNSNTDMVASRLADMIRVREDFRNQINELTGLNIDFEFMPEDVIEWRYDLREEGNRSLEDGNTEEGGENGQRL